ncbi:unnamed protein product, partial [Brassica rapa]
YYLSATFWSAALYCYLQFSVKAYPSFETLVTCCWIHLPLLHAFARFDYLAWRFTSQQSIFWKRCLLASEFADVSSPVGYVENFPTWWLMERGS